MSVFGYPTSPTSFDRFTNSDVPDLFFGAPYDWSGVGQSGNRWGTMISPTHFIASAHNAPGTGTSLRLYRDNTLGNFENHVVSAITTIGGTDLAVGTLQTAVSSQIEIYPFLVLNSTADYGNLEIITVGLATGGAGQRMGRNTIEPSSPFSPNTVFPFTVPPSTGPMFVYDQDPVPGEALVEPGDSGGPTFVVVGGQLALVGLHWARSTTLPYTADNFVPAFINQMNALLGPNESVTVVTVPEPGPMVLLALGAGLAWWRVRRARGMLLRTER